MGNRPRSKKADDNFGKGKVTTTQIAFIVDRYLLDNNYAQSRTAFRDEASSLIAKSPVQEAPRGLLSLGAMLNEYISLKEQKLMIEQERIRLEQEKWRIQTLLQGMQSAMNAYNTTPSAPIPAIQAPIAKPTASVLASSMPSKRVMVPQNTPSYTTIQPCPSKRKSTAPAAKGPSAAKRSRGGGSCSKKLPISTSESPLQPSEAATSQLPQGSSIAKRLFSPPLPSTPTKSPTTPEEITPTHCTIVAYEKITVSPFKQMASYTIEKSHCILSSSPGKETTRRRDHVKGRLDFDQSEAPLNVSDNNTLTSESDKEVDLFDFDFANLEAQLGSNFCLSELLDLDCEDIEYSCLNVSTESETISALSSPDNQPGAGQFMSEYSTTLTEIHTEEDMQFQGVNNLTAVKSVTKCTSVVSPAKSLGSCLYRENCDTKN